MKTEAETAGISKNGDTMLVIDTDVAVDYLRGNPSIIRYLQGMQKLFITSISVAELYVGVYHDDNKEKHLQVLHNFLSGVDILNVNEESCELFGKIKAHLKRKGIPIGDFDTMIASITMSHGLGLATMNLRHFKNIAGLKIQKINKE